MSMEEARGLAAALAERDPPLGLAPEGAPDAATSEAVRRLAAGDTPEAIALRSALLLWNGDLDGSHALSQELHTPTGSLLHGIMHRMEGDYWNAEYWFRRVGAHPCYADVAREAAPVDGTFAADGTWDPYGFNRAVERAVRGGDAAEIGRLERVQRAELTAVVRYCIEQRYGGRALG
jgi:hypothetical protein